MTTTQPQLVFFGSFQEYSAQILQGLLDNPAVNVVAVVTTPPFIAPKTGKLQKNPVQLLAEKAQLPVLTPSSLNKEALAELTTTAKKFDYFVTAGYGKLLPNEWLTTPPAGALNLHFSLLPKFRGANPAEWAILLDETETGVTLIEMSPEFDTGKMIAQASIQIANDETRETLYQKLYALGAQTLPSMLIGYANYQAQGENSLTTTGISFFLPPLEQPESPTPYAKRFHREDAFIDWPSISQAMIDSESKIVGATHLLSQILNGIPFDSAAKMIDRAVRALAGFPGVWTTIPTAKGEKRMKILSTRLSISNQLQLEQVQIEGQQPAHWNQVKNQLSSAV